MLEVPPLPPGETINVPGRGELFVRRLRGGDGVPVLLLHGWMASADINWFLLYEALGRRHPVIAPDHRGHGRGPRPAVRFAMEDCADDAAALLRHLGVGGAVVVGYSMGGSIAIHLWRRHPDLVRGLVLGGTALEFREGLRERVLRGLMHLVSVLFRWPAGRYALARVIGHRRTIPFALRPYRAWIEGEFSRADPTDVGEAGRQLLHFDAKEMAGAMACPAAVVVTARDTLVPAELQRRMAEALGARAFEIDADHAAPVIAAERFAEIVLEAIAWIDARSTQDPTHGPPAGERDRP
jgi:3-oxoadipate enol-lactonase